MNKGIILKKLREIGLTPHESKCYLSLLERDSLAVGEISKIAEIPRPNAYHIMEKLLAKGLCVSKPGKLQKYSMTDPQFLKQKILPELNARIDDEFDKEKTNLQRKLEERQKDILSRKKQAALNIDDLLKTLSPLYSKNRNNNSPLDYLEIFKDPAQAMSKFNELMINAKEEVLSIEKPSANWSPPPPKVFNKLNREMSASIKKLLKNGVRSRSIFELSPGGERRKWQLELLKIFARAGDKIRITKDAPMKLTTIDSKIVLFALEDPTSVKPSYYTSHIIYHQAMARGLKMLFEAVWAQAEDLDAFLKKEKQK